MLIIAFITNYAAVDHIIDHLKLFLVTDISLFPLSPQRVASDLSKKLIFVTEGPCRRIAHHEVLMAAQPAGEYFL